MDLFLTVRIMNQQTYQKLLSFAKQMNTTPEMIVFDALQLYFDFYSKKGIDVSDTHMV